MPLFAVPCEARAMHKAAARIGALAALLLAALVSASASPRDASGSPATGDPLAAEIARLMAYLQSSTAKGEIWDDVRRGSEPMLLRAEAALQDGRPLLALNRLAAAREGLSAARYLYSLPGTERQDPKLFEAEWRRVGEVLVAELGQPAASALDGVAPAAARAIAEAALPQVRVYYEASLDYGQNTVPDAGLYYIGAALAQRELAALVRGLGAAPSGPQPPLRSLEPELAALEAEMLAAYRPPASIDRHVDFIRASAALKEARELDALGLRYGALLRYLQSLQRFAPVRSAPSVASLGVPAGALEARLQEHAARLATGGADHTIGRLFLETAQALAAPGKETDPAAAQAIAESVLPRYFAALEPATPLPPRPAARATVTLVRWPYT
jgi:hypothetical protein